MSSEIIMRVSGFESLSGMPSTRKFGTPLFGEQRALSAVIWTPRITEALGMKPRAWAILPIVRSARPVVALDARALNIEPGRH